MKNKLFFASILTVSLLISSQSKAEKRFYFGAGYQTSRVSYPSSQPAGYYDVTIEQINPDLTIENTVTNGDGTHTTTTTTTTEFTTESHVAAYLDYKNFYKDIFNSVNVFAGVNINPVLALELGYFRQSGDKSTNNSNQYLFNGQATKSSATLQIASLDGVLTQPLIDNILNLNAIIGVSAVNFDTDIKFYQNGAFSGSSSQKSTDLGFNAGIGLEAKINETFSVRAIVKGTLLPGGDMIKDIISSSVGFKVSL